MICWKCGNENSDSCEFCTNCGAKIGSNTQNFNNNYTTKPIKNNKKKMSFTTILILSIIGVLILFFIIVGIVLLNSMSKNTVIPQNLENSNTSKSIETTTNSKTSTIVKAMESGSMNNPIIERDVGEESYNSAKNNFSSFPNKFANLMNSKIFVNLTGNDVALDKFYKAEGLEIYSIVFSMDSLGEDIRYFCVLKDIEGYQYYIEINTKNIIIGDTTIPAGGYLTGVTKYGEILYGKESALLGLFFAVEGSGRLVILSTQNEDLFSGATGVKLDNNTSNIRNEQQKSNYNESTNNSNYSNIDDSEINFEIVGKNIKVTYQNNIMLSYMTYKWDNGEETKIEILDTSVNEEIEVLKGLHTLSVTIVDTEGNKLTKEQQINGVSSESDSITNYEDTITKEEEKEGETFLDKYQMIDF